MSGTYRFVLEWVWGWGGCIAFRLEFPCPPLFRFRMLLTSLMFSRLNYWESRNLIAHQIEEKHVYGQNKTAIHLPNVCWSIRREISFDCGRDQIQEEEKGLFCVKDLYSSLGQWRLQVPTHRCMASLSLSRHGYNRSCAVIFQTRLCVYVSYTLYIRHWGTIPKHLFVVFSTPVGIKSVSFSSWKALWKNFSEIVF